MFLTKGEAQIIEVYPILALKSLYITSSSRAAAASPQSQLQEKKVTFDQITYVQPLFQIKLKWDNDNATDILVALLP